MSEGFKNYGDFLYDVIFTSSIGHNVDSYDTLSQHILETLFIGILYIICPFICPHPPPHPRNLYYTLRRPFFDLRHVIHIGYLL